MAIWSLTKEKVDKLLQQKAAKEDELNELLKLSPKDMWSIDLDAFVEEWHSSEKKRLEGAAAVPGKKKSNVLSGKRGGKAVTKRRGKNSDDEDQSVDDEYSPKKPKKTSNTKQTTLSLATAEPAKAKAKVESKPRAKAIKKDPESQVTAYGDPQVRETVPQKPVKTTDLALDMGDWAQLAKGIGESHDKPLFQTKPKSTTMFSVISSTESSPAKPAPKAKKAVGSAAKGLKPSIDNDGARKERPARSRAPTKKYADLEEDDSEEDEYESASEAELESEGFSD